VVVEHTLRVGATKGTRANPFHFHVGDQLWVLLRTELDDSNSLAALVNKLFFDLRTMSSLSVSSLNQVVHRVSFDLLDSNLTASRKATILA
jgi:hypothetical protein